MRDILDRLVAEGIATTVSECVEPAVRCRAADLDDDDEDQLMAAAQAGLADIRAGTYATIDGPEAHTAFWNQIGNLVKEQVAEMHSNAGKSENVY
jgi:hypothetical protein